MSAKRFLKDYTEAEKDVLVAHILSDDKWREKTVIALKKLLLKVLAKHHVAVDLKTAARDFEYQKPAINKALSQLSGSTRKKVDNFACFMLENYVTWQDYLLSREVFEGSDNYDTAVQGKATSLQDLL